MEQFVFSAYKSNLNCLLFCIFSFSFGRPCQQPSHQIRSVKSVTTQLKSHCDRITVKIFRNLEEKKRKTNSFFSVCDQFLFSLPTVFVRSEIMACSANKINGQIDIPKPKSLAGPLKVKEKRLMGAGPSNPPNNILQSLSRPMMGHLHPETLQAS